MKPWKTIAVFAACLAVVFAATAWISLTTLRLDRLQAETARHAALEESMRLALWRMDAAMTPLLARENARPYFHYSAFYPAERAYTMMFQGLDAQEILLPSPLLTSPTPQVLLHFQIGPDGAFSSPQVPTGRMRVIAESQYGVGGKIKDCEAMLAELGEKLAGISLASVLPTGNTNYPSETAGVMAANPVASSKGRKADTQQVARNMQEFHARVSQQNAETAPALNDQPARRHFTPVGEGVMHPLWAGDSLLIIRRIEANRQTYFQGCWLMWPTLKRELLDQVADLLPQADLRPLHRTDKSDGRVLASLPVGLRPGPAADLPASGMSPVKWSLVAVWACVLLAAGSFAVLLIGMIQLSERRAAFVSAVTHELRTPLTTFRMYTEMLADGMVPDEARRNEYLKALVAEANRLSHLVQNVLAYSRLERGKSPEAGDTVTAGAMLDRIRPRLAQRTEQAGMTLLVECPADAAETTLRTDAEAVEQILFNLVDNACKYAANGEDRRIHLEVCSSGRFLSISAKDHGPGISPQDARTLFRPFSKSAQRAALSAPGVGLGLALSRRLARRLGGDLKLGGASPDGASFTLVLKRTVGEE